MSYKKILVLLLAVSSITFAQKKQANVLMICVDDLKPMLGCYGNDLAQTPNIDAIAAHGTVFLNNSCQQAICGPSRASLLTGQYPDATKVYDLRTKLRKKNPNILTLPQYFKEQGYETTGVGKTFDPRTVAKGEDPISWSIPYRHDVAAKYYANKTKPMGGFLGKKAIASQKEFRKYLKEKGIHFNKNKAERKKAQLLFKDSRPVTECADVADNGYKDGAVNLAALDLLDQLANKEKPFFLSVGFAKPHLPFVSPKKYWDLYDREKINIHPEQGRGVNTPEFAFHNSGELFSYTSYKNISEVTPAEQKKMIHGYLACVSYIDALVGQLTAKLEVLGVADNTVICLWGDHGFHLGDHNMYCKHSNFEQAVRSPLIIANPKGKAIKTNSPSEFVDIFPTLCDLTGLEIPKHLPGVSLKKAMCKKGVKIRKAALSQYPRTVEGNKMMGYTLRSERYRYTKWLAMNYMKGERKGNITGVELYDYENDPFEQNNLALKESYKDLVSEFEQEFKRRNVAQIK
ncbi:sulfatase [Flavobacteriaceae bacterium]|nr:sulfatase [Flavobacteriaceae bacterium]